MSYNQLLQELITVKNMEEFREVLQNDETFGEFYTYNLLGVPSFPVGGSKDSWKTGEGYNNRYAVDSNSDAVGALTERLTNGHDAVVERWINEKRFEKIPTTPDEAQSEVVKDDKSDHGGTYLFVTEQNNTSVLDTGCGVRKEDFVTTLMALGGKGKQDKPYLAGGFGFGGSAVYRFSDVTIIVTRSMFDPNVITFTAVFRVHRENFKDPCYVYMVAPDGSPLTADASVLSSADHFNVTNLKSLTKAPDLHKIIDNKLILGDSGTMVRMINYQWPPSMYTYKQNIYSTMRERLFGYSVKTHYFYLRGGGADAYNGIRGLRHVLHNSNDRLSVDVLYRQPPHGIMTNNGRSRATISIWVINHPKDTDGNYILNKSHETNAKVPLTRILLGKTVSIPIFITRNGQTHKRLPVYVKLRNAGLKELDGKTIIEINIDNMNAIERSDFLTSNREEITKSALEDINEEILRIFKEDAGVDDTGTPGVLTRLAEKIREDDFKNHKSDQLKIEDDVKKILSKVSGSIFATYGNGNANSGGNGTGKTNGSGDSGSGGGGGGGGDSSPVILREVPTFLRAAKKTTIQLDNDEYFTVRTDGNYTNADRFHIFLEEAPFLEPSSDKYQRGLNEGREAFRLHCKPNTPIGTEGRVVVMLERPDHPEGDLEVEWSIRVIQKMEKDNKDNNSTKGRSAIPEEQIEWVDSTDSLWSRMETGNLKDTEVAFNYDLNKAGNTVIIYINKKFNAFENAKKLLNKNQDMNDLKESYGNAIYLSVLSYIDSGLEVEDGENPTFTIESLHKLKAATAKTMVIQTLTGLSRNTDSRKMNKKEALAEDEPAE